MAHGKSLFDIHLKNHRKGDPVTVVANEAHMAPEDSLVEHLPKRLRLYSEEDVMLNHEEYQEAVQTLQDEYNNRKKNKMQQNWYVII